MTKWIRSLHNRLYFLHHKLILFYIYTINYGGVTDTVGKKLTLDDFNSEEKFHLHFLTKCVFLFTSVLSILLDDLSRSTIKVTTFFYDYIRKLIQLLQNAH